MTKKPKRTPDQRRRFKLAGRIAMDLFTDASGTVARRLMLISNDRQNLGGWGWGPVRDRIYAAIERAAKSKR